MEQGAVMRRWLIALLCLFFVSANSVKTPSTVVNNSGLGGSPWINPSNAITEDDTSSTVDFELDAGGASQLLLASDFGFSIPSGSTIDGILAEWKASRTDLFGGLIGNYVQTLCKAGVCDKNPVGGYEVSDLTTTLVFYSIGGATNLWGTTWTVTDINASDFGVYVRVVDGSDPQGETANVDVIRLTVYYTEASGTKKRIIGYGNGQTKTETIN